MLKSFPTFTDFNISGKNGSVVLYLSTFVPFLIAIICIAIIVLLINSTYGRAFKAIRDDEVAAEAMGINLAKHKMLSLRHRARSSLEWAAALLCDVRRERTGEGLYRDHDL